MAIALRSVRRIRRGDDGSIAMALLLIMVGVSLAALFVPLVITQTGNSKLDVRRQHSLDAAQAGLDYMVGQIRGASDTTQANGSNGSRALLPCTLNNTTVAPVTGAVSTAGNERYRVAVYYFARDPHAHPEWLNDPTKWIKCSSTAGTQVVPAYAVIQSTGTDDPSGSFDSGARTVQATYAVKSLNVNIPGGSIKMSANDTLCLDAGSSRPTSGTIVTVQPCSSGVGSQKWTFDTNFRFLLTDSDDPSSGDLGMCMTAAFSHFAGEKIVMRPCTSTVTPEQQFSYMGNSQFTATEPGTKVPQTWCWATSSVAADATLGLNNCVADDPSNYKTTQAFGPDASVGPGGPIGTTSSPYLVNYQQFGRCITLSHYSVDPADQYYTKEMYSYPCSSTPDPASQAMNMEYYYPLPTGTATNATGQIKSYITKKNSSGATVYYCLISPMTLNGLPYVDKCSSVPAANTTWTVWRDTGAYGTSYRITDASRPDPYSSLGYCLSPSDPNGPNPQMIPGSDISKLVVTTCSSSTLQKWNAPPGLVASPVTDYQEVNGASN